MLLQKEVDTEMADLPRVSTVKKTDEAMEVDMVLEKNNEVI